MRKPTVSAAEPAGEANVAASPAFTPKPYAGPHDSQGLPRPVGCQNLDRCGSATWRSRCHICEKAFVAGQSLAPVELTIGAADIPHHGVVG